MNANLKKRNEKTTIGFDVIVVVVVAVPAHELASRTRRYSHTAHHPIPTASKIHGPLRHRRPAARGPRDETLDRWKSGGDSAPMSCLFNGVQ